MKNISKNTKSAAATAQYRIIYPEIAVHLSIKAYKIAADMFNHKIEKDYQNGIKQSRKVRTRTGQVKEEVIETPQGVFLKRKHFDTMVQLLSLHREHLRTLAGIHVSKSVDTGKIIHVHPNFSMAAAETYGLPMKVKRLAAIVGEKPATVRNHLRRLELAGIITVLSSDRCEKHLKKYNKGITVKISRDVLIMYDRKNTNYLPNSEIIHFTKENLTKSLSEKSTPKIFARRDNSSRPEIILTTSKSNIFSITKQKAEDRKDFTKTDLTKSTITQTTETLSGVFPQSFDNQQVVGECKAEEVCPELTEVRKNKNNFTGTITRTPKTDIGGVSEVEKNGSTPAQKKIGNSLKKRAAAKIERKTGETVFDRVRRRNAKKNSGIRTGIIPHRQEVGFEKQKKELRSRLAALFFGFLTENIFADKQFSPSYRSECLRIIEQDYFSGQNTIKALNWKFNELRERVLIAKNWIAGFEKQDGGKFDTEFFYPKAFLQNHSGINFRATEKMLKNDRKWKIINAYNRKLGDSKLMHRMNAIARKVERNEMYFTSGLEKVKALTSDTDAYIKIFTFRITGKFQNL